MFSVLIPTCSTTGILNPGVTAAPWQRQTMVYTRQGRLYLNQKAAEALARKRLGRVVDVNSGRIIADFL